MTLDEIIENALQEDIGEGDHSSLACIPKENKGKAQLFIKEEGILSGTQVAQKVFQKINPEIQVSIHLSDGAPIKKGDIAMTVAGNSVSLLSAERLALNFMQRMSGIATYTNKLVKMLEGLPTKILDTRKTTPNFRLLEKMAVKAGGGENHRFGLYDMIMIKDNHIDFAGGIQQAINATKNYLQKINKNLFIVIEARNLDEINEIIKTGGVNRILIDNFSIPQMKEAVQLIAGRYETEASGGITEKNIRAYAECGVTFISIGALTHQIKSLDMSLKVV